MLLFSQTAYQISFPLCGEQERRIIKRSLKEKLYIPVFVEKCGLQESVLKCRVKVFKFMYFMQLVLHLVHSVLCIKK